MTMVRIWKPSTILYCHICHVHVFVFSFRGKRKGGVKTLHVKAVVDRLPIIKERKKEIKKKKYIAPCCGMNKKKRHYREVEELDWPNKKQIDERKSETDCLQEAERGPCLVTTNSHWINVTMLCPVNPWGPGDMPRTRKRGINLPLHCLLTVALQNFQNFPFLCHLHTDRMYVQFGMSNT